MSMVDKGSMYIKIPQGSYKFGDGTGNDYATLSSISGMTPASGNAVSMSCWIKVNNLGANPGGTWSNIIGKHESNKDCGLSITTHYEPVFCFHASSSHYAKSTTKVSGGSAGNLDKWFHIAGTYAGGDKVSGDRTLSIYVNGELEGTATELSGNSSIHGNNMFIGAGSGNPLSGQIHDVRIWSGVCLTANQVKQVYNGIDIHSDKLIGYYKFTDRDGTTLEDSTSYENDGTLTGGEWYEREIRCWNTRWDESNYNVIIETFVDACDRNLLFRNVTPGANREIYNILGTPKYIDTTYNSGNTLIFEPISNYGVSSVRHKRIVAVKNISDTFINYETFGVKIEGVRLDIT